MLQTGHDTSHPYPSHITPLLTPELDEASDVFHTIPNADTTFHDVVHPQTHFQTQRRLVTLIKRSYRHLEGSGQKGGACMRFFDTKIVKDVQESRHGNSHTEIPSSEFKHEASLRASLEAWRVSFCSWDDRHSCALGRCPVLVPSLGRFYPISGLHYCTWPVYINAAIVRRNKPLPLSSVLLPSCFF